MTDRTFCDSVSLLISLPGVTVRQLLSDMISESECALINNTLHPHLNREETK